MIKNLFKRGAITVGIATLAVTALAGTAQADTHAKNVKFGQRGDAVGCVQQGLRLAGYQVDRDGVFGKDTKAKVIAFQAAHHLDQDGIVGPKTGDALYYGYLENHGLVETELCGSVLPLTHG